VAALERVAGRGDSVALTDVRIDGRLDVVLEVREPGWARELAPSLAAVRGVSAPQELHLTGEMSVLLSGQVTDTVERGSQWEFD
jgi:hypothetical protein